MILCNPFPETCCFAVKGSTSDLDLIHPLEIENGRVFSSISRKAEFFSGRRCAHIALKKAGYPNLPVLRGRNRSPLWPFSIVGSITHGAAFAAAIIAKPHSGVMGLGIDIEDLSRKIKTDITKHTLTDWEIEKWGHSPGLVSREVRIIFSIKEAIYKCFNPIDKIYLGFHDAEIIEMDETSFRARLLKEPFVKQIFCPVVLEGRLSYFENAVFAAIQIQEEQFWEK
ncbi:4'-phosphopantetheinyl transferase superfamily protein [bacterium]|nr:4'-phosphopantetheinyl transferase superfamily protein [bacterium]